tara:strand:+ start:60342 stop:63608 length:3267 start_codon:yes stop_codon:yes gene_type:complete
MSAIDDGSPIEAAPQRSLRSFFIVACCFLLSGFAALLYETVWLRQFSIFFGTSDQALAVVLGTYMGGLAIGSLIASKFAPRLRRPLLTYGFLELGIGVTALMVPLMLWIVRKVQVASFGGSPEPPAADELSQILFSFAGAFAATILPTAMMGATLPLLAKHVVNRNDHLGWRIGLLYTINTLGAVLGTLTAAFVCLPALGLGKTVYIGVLINVAVFGLVWWLFQSTTSQGTDGQVKSVGLDKSISTSATRSMVNQDDSVEAADTSRHWVLWLIGFSGAVSFCYEVLFTRILGHFLGGSVFAFAAMLASFLLGITIGGGIASKFAREVSRAKIGFLYAQCCTAALALAAWYGVEHLATTINEIAASQTEETYPRTILAILILLPPAVSIGMTFPFAIRIHARDERDAASSSAKVYAANTIGGVLGALLTGTYLLPSTNYQLTLATAVVASLVIAALAILFGGVRLNHAAAVLAVVVLLGVYFPSQPEQLLRVSPFPKTIRRGVLEFVKTGRSATVTTFDDHGSYAFSTNGLPEAGTQPKGALINPTNTAAWLGILPALVHPETDSMLVVGFGSGMAAGSAPRSVSSIDVFELEEGIIEANRLVGSARAVDPLSDPRIHLIMNDGRNGLALTSKTYDAVVSQPSHPWTAGASHLYTREFAKLVFDHLNDDGVFVQWMDSGFLDPDLLRSLGATLLDVFPSVYLFQPSESTLLFYASKNPWQMTPGVPKYRSRSDQTLIARMGMQTKDDPIAILSLDDGGMRKMCEGATVTTDNNNLLALRMRLTSTSDDIGKTIQAMLNKHDPLCQPPADESPYANVDRGYVAFRRYLIGRHSNGQAIVDSIPDHDAQQLVRARVATHFGDFEKAEKILNALVKSSPDNADAWLGLFLLGKNSPIFDSAQYTDEQWHDRLSAKHRDIFDGFRAIESNDFESMIEIDARLSKLNPTDPGFVAAMALRIDWRLRDEQSGTRKVRGSECLKLIDQVLPYGLASKFIVYRLNAAVLAGRPNIALTTAHHIAAKASRIGHTDDEDDDKFEQESPEQIKQYLRHCLNVIEPLQRDPRVDTLRALGVHYFVSETLAILEQAEADVAP